MKEKLPKSESVDIMLFSEGTYPFVKGGVSSWILQLMKGLPDFTFGVCFIGATPYIDDKKLEISYELPSNLKHLEVHYLFYNNEDILIKRRKGNKEGFKAIEKLYQSFKKNIGELPLILQDIDFYLKDVTYEDFLYSKCSWDFLVDKYEENCPDIPFIDYFWTLRNIHRPIWILAKIVKDLPECKIYHSPSTGYAGFLGALSSYTSKKPFFLTEHGIYTRERKIDMLSADWIAYNKPSLLQQNEEFNYIKRMWINFFDKLGLFCYHRANMIFSLYSGARNIQIAYGAKKEKTKVIPNGVDVNRLQATMKYRKKHPDKIVTLIGRVVPIKDIKTFIRAIKIASENIKDIEGWIVGAVDEDMEYVLECQQMALSLGLKSSIQKFKNNKTVQTFDELISSSDKIKFFGHINIEKVLPLSALQTLSSISEGMPLVILEGFAAGVPCVATDVGSCRDLIEGGIDEEDKKLGKAGAITGIANPDALAKEYIKFLTFENREWHKAQQVAIKRVQKYYRQEVFLKEYKSFYNKAIGISWEEFERSFFKMLAPCKTPKKAKYIDNFSIRYFKKRIS